MSALPRRRFGRTGLAMPGLSLGGMRVQQSWQQGLPSLEDTPGQLNLPVLLWLHHLLEALAMEGFAIEGYACAR